MNAMTLRMLQTAASRAHEQYADAIMISINFGYLADQDTHYKPAAKSAIEAVRVCKLSMVAAEHSYQCYLDVYESEQPF